MTSRHHIFIAVLTVLVIVTFGPSLSLAQRYPDHPIQFVIANVAGASMDITGRLLASELEKAIGQKVIPSNKPGASAVLGTDAVVKAKKDGYTLLYTSVSGLTFAPVTNPEIVHYDPAKDLEFLGFHYAFPSGINVSLENLC
jgi:tripartite-type tricarboxylate transporter receptor subunit TctC